MSGEPTEEFAVIDPEHVRRAITSIYVDGLHGKFTYEIHVGVPSGSEDASSSESLASVSEDRLTLLYGRNGTGKTSLLRLLFHALSAAPDRGHRTALREIRFRELKVSFADGTYVRYSRQNEVDRGRFLAEVSFGPDSKIIKCEFWRDSDPSVVTLSASEQLQYYRPRRQWISADQITFDVGAPPTVVGMEPSEETQFMQGLAALGVNPVFLEDTREITSDVLDNDDARLRARHTRTSDDESTRRRELEIEDALERVRRYLSQLAFAGTQTGSLRVDTVYVNVAAAIIQQSSTVGRPKARLVPELSTKVNMLNERAARFQHYGLMPESPMLGLAELLTEAELKHGPLLTQVLTPHLDGFAARMDALEPGLDAVAAFVDALNGFLTDKHVSFTPSREGLRIIDPNTGERIAPSDLSSGEKQIVLMFSDIISLQGDTWLFLIDEPELSLNPDWQRSLMPSLLGVTEGSGMQLIAATHSIEIMAKYRDRRRHLG